MPFSESALVTQISSEILSAIGGTPTPDQIAGVENHAETIKDAIKYAIVGALDGTGVTPNIVA